MYANLGLVKLFVQRNEFNSCYKMAHCINIIIFFKYNITTV